MNPSLHTALLAGLSLALVAMFAGLLLARHQGVADTLPLDQRPPPAHSAGVQRTTFDLDEIDEWETVSVQVDG